MLTNEHIITGDERKEGFNVVIPVDIGYGEWEYLISSLVSNAVKEGDKVCLYAATREEVAPGYSCFEGKVFRGNKHIEIEGYCQTANVGGINPSKWLVMKSSHKDLQPVEGEEKLYWSESIPHEWLDN